MAVAKIMTSVDSIVGMIFSHGHHDEISQGRTDMVLIIAALHSAGLVGKGISERADL
jgi:hypothetical protein